MQQKEIYSQLDKLTKEELIGIIIENQCFVSEEWFNLLKRKEINIPFEKFWMAYDYRKGSKKGAETARKRLTNKEREDAMLAIPFYVKQRDPNYICMATTWIHQKRWEGILEEENKKQKQKESERKEKLQKFSQGPIPWELRDVD